MRLKWSLLTAVSRVLVYVCVRKVVLATAPQSLVTFFRRAGADGTTGQALKICIGKRRVFIQVGGGASELRRRVRTTRAARPHTYTCAHCAHRTWPFLLTILGSAPARDVTFGKTHPGNPDQTRLHTRIDKPCAQSQKQSTRSTARNFSKTIDSIIAT